MIYQTVFMLHGAGVKMNAHAIPVLRMCFAEFLRMSNKHFNQ